MTKFRVWHASRDAYHCAFRMMRLLSFRSKAMPFERLRILDLFLLFPTLLHDASMPRATRTEFSSLQVPKKQDVFMNLPSAAAAAQDLRLFQNTAASYLLAKGIFSRDALAGGTAEISSDSIPVELRDELARRNADASGLMTFLTGSFSEIPLSGIEGIYRRTGLPARITSS